MIYKERHPTAAEIASAAASAVRGVWLIAGTPAGEPYPCRCGEPVRMADGSTYRPKTCSPAFCPCSGRLDPQGPECCAIFNTPERAAQAQAEYRRRRAAGMA